MDASVEFLLQNLKQMAMYHSNLIKDAISEFEQLNKELEKLKVIMKQVSQRYKKDEIYKAWERQIRETVYDIEDTIDTYVTQISLEDAKEKINCKPNLAFRRNLSEMVYTLRRRKVKPLLSSFNFANFTVAEEPDSTVAEARYLMGQRTQNIVGFEAEVEKLINLLSTESSKLEIASIVGMAGLGKTTLAWKVFEDPRIKSEFPVRIWVNISDDLNMKKVLLTILSKFTSYLPDESVEELIIKARKKLKETKFFIVMDDVWTLSAWDMIKEILPSGNHIGRVLVTTRHQDVAEYSSMGNPHHLRFLTTIESWQLLQYEVYGELNIVPRELMSIGNAIAMDCDGLPLSIVVIGNILMERKSGVSSILIIKKEWEEVYSDLKTYLVVGDRRKLLLSIFSLSYEKVSYELRNCFLYLGMFPENANISVKELVRLWIAEGFIRETRWDSLEEVALDNLKELINRNLVMVKEAKLDGEPKICHIHNTIREICKAEAKYENLNLFQEITRSESGFEPRNTERFHRICIHSYPLGFLKKTKVPIARSFLCFDRSPMVLKPTDMASVTDSFGLLRVYNAKSIKFPIFPLKFVQLSLLRYFTLVVEQCTSLPEVISELRNLQTLIVDVTSSTLDIKADLWKMIQLRHLKTKASITLKKDGRGDGGDNLQTLSRLSPESCSNEVFQKAKNLVTLGIQGELNKLVDIRSLGLLEQLHKLKLVNEKSTMVAAENPLRCMPDLQYFPPNLKYLVLSGTYMCWTEMSILSGLKFLEVLKLKNNAFVGYCWDAESTFDHLECLYIDKSMDLVLWKSNVHTFPRLRILSLNSCEKLIEVPYAVCENLEMLRLENVTRDLILYVESIAEDKRKHGVMFKLDVIPGNKIHKYEL